MKQLSITESTVTEAMAQIDGLDDLNAKDRGCLRLLTEEMFSMANELLGADKLNFEIDRDEKKYSLRVSVKAKVDENAREQFLSMSSDGRNEANKGVKGVLGFIVEALLYNDEPTMCAPAFQYGMCSGESGYSQMWMLSRYIDQAPREAVTNSWDGMEKSIIANFADDVAIGVRSGKLEMTVTKAFA